MEYVINELRGVNNKLKQLQMMIEKGGSERQIELMKVVEISLEDLRNDLQDNRRTPQQVLAEELAVAIDEVVERTGKPLSEVLAQAKVIYDNHIEEVRDLESRKRAVNDLFKGW